MARIAKAIQRDMRNYNRENALGQLMPKGSPARESILYGTKAVWCDDDGIRHESMVDDLPQANPKIVKEGK